MLNNYRDLSSVFAQVVIAKIKFGAAVKFLVNFAESFVMWYPQWPRKDIDVVGSVTSLPAVHLNYISLEPTVVMNHKCLYEGVELQSRATPDSAATVPYIERLRSHTAATRSFLKRANGASPLGASVSPTSLPDAYNMSRNVCDAHVDTAGGVNLFAEEIKLEDDEEDICKVEPSDDSNGAADFRNAAEKQRLEFSFSRRCLRVTRNTAKATEELDGSFQRYCDDKGPQWLRGISTITNGVYLQGSSLGQDAGLGLFAGKKLYRGDRITEFVGRHISKTSAERLRRENKGSHIVSLDFWHEYVDGIKVPLVGVGGASFANDGSKKLGGPGNNACFLRWIDDRHGCRRIFLQARRDIEPGEEVFVSYATKYWEIKEKQELLEVLKLEENDQPESAVRADTNNSNNENIKNENINNENINNNNKKKKKSVKQLENTKHRKVVSQSQKKESKKSNKSKPLKSLKLRISQKRSLDDPILSALCVKTEPPQTNASGRPALSFADCKVEAVVTPRRNATSSSSSNTIGASYYVKSKATKIRAARIVKNKGKAAVPRRAVVSIKQEHGTVRRQHKSLKKKRGRLRGVLESPPPRSLAVEYHSPETEFCWSPMMVPFGHPD